MRKSNTKQPFSLDHQILCHISSYVVIHLRTSVSIIIINASSSTTTVTITDPPHHRHLVIKENNHVFHSIWSPPPPSSSSRSPTDLTQEEHCQSHPHQHGHHDTCTHIRTLLTSHKTLKVHPTGIKYRIKCWSTHSFVVKTRTPLFPFPAIMHQLCYPRISKSFCLPYFIL